MLWPAHRNVMFEVILIVILVSVAGIISSPVVVILTKLAKWIMGVSFLMIHVGLTVLRNHRNTPTAMVNSMTSSKQVNKVKPTVNRSTPDNVAVSPNQHPGGGGYNR